MGEGLLNGCTLSFMRSTGMGMR